MSQKKRSPAMAKIFSCKHFLTNQLNKKIVKLQHREEKRQAKLSTVPDAVLAEHDHTGHDHTA
jgi:hypothetical protein